MQLLSTMSKPGRPAGPTKTLWRKRLTADEVQAVEALLAGSPQAAPLPATMHCLTPADNAPAGNAGVQVGAEKNSTATPLTVVEGASSEPLPREYFKQELKHCREQLTLERTRADELQGALDEERAENGRLALQMEQLQAMSGSERASAYIARLQAQIAALGGKKSEFDQE
jgi:hypothetical protein